MECLNSINNNCAARQHWSLFDGLGMTTVVNMEDGLDGFCSNAASCSNCMKSTVPEVLDSRCLCAIATYRKHILESGKFKHNQFLKKLQLRFLEAEDICMLKELCQEWFPIRYPDTWFNLVVFDRKFFSLAATIDGKLIAVFIAEIKPRWQVPKEDADLLSFAYGRETKVAYILSIGVHQPYRRYGVASFLLEVFLTHVSTGVQENNSNLVKAIYLHVLSTNFVAINFYKNHKFKALHYLPSYYVINGCFKDGYSYVMHVNGGQPHNTLLYYMAQCFKILNKIQLYRLPSAVCIGINYAFKCLSRWPSFPPLVSRSQQSHQL